MSVLDDFEDLDVFTAGEFSTIAQVDSATSSLTELSGIFDESYQDMFGGIEALTDTTSEGRKFCFQVQTSQTEDLHRGDRLTVYGKNYQITGLRPQHDGKITHLILKQDFS